jgi:hypothetical protein
VEVYLALFAGECNPQARDHRHQVWPEEFCDARKHTVDKAARRRRGIEVSLYSDKINIQSFQLRGDIE